MRQGVFRSTQPVWCRRISDQNWTPEENTGKGVEVLRTREQSGERVNDLEWTGDSPCTLNCLFPQYVLVFDSSIYGPKPRTESCRHPVNVFVRSGVKRVDLLPRYRRLRQPCGGLRGKDTTT